MLGLGSLFMASLVPVLKVALLCCVGAVMARQVGSSVRSADAHCPSFASESSSRLHGHSSVSPSSSQSIHHNIELWHLLRSRCLALYLSACLIQGVLSVDGRRVLSGLLFQLLIPCLFLDKLGSGVGVREALSLWPVTVNMLVQHSLGLALGWLLVLVLQPPVVLRRHMLVANMIGNVGNLPLVLVSSLGADPALASLGGAALGERYVMLGGFAATLIQFPALVVALRPTTPERITASDSCPEANGIANSAAAGPLLTSATTERHSPPLIKPVLQQAEPQAPLPSIYVPKDVTQPLDSPATMSISGTPDHNGQLDEDMTQADNRESSDGSRRYGSTLFIDSPGSFSKDVQPLLQRSRLGNSCEPASSEGSMRAHHTSRTVTLVMVSIRSIWKAAEPLVSGILTPPTLACFVAITVASFQPLQVI
jgi:hypothetical protein